MPSPDIAHLVRILAEHPEGASLPRLAKRLDARASTLLRALAPYTADAIDGQAGPGWIRVEQTDKGWLVHLTQAGKDLLAADPNPASPE